MQRIRDVIVAGLIAVTACSRTETRVTPPATVTPPVIVGYERARWRLAPPELSDTVLWVSHIVVAHENSRPAATRLRRGSWVPDSLPQKRTDAQALAEAIALAETLRRDPSQFEALARQRSDDVVTRNEGGSLGGVRASELPPEFLDALAVLKPGEVSRVVRSAFGYHVILRRQVPAPGQVSGKRIVVRYAGTGGSKAAITRTRDDAKKLADKIVSLARSDSTTFASLVTQYSDNEDKARGGDIGVWSLRDPGLLAREIERLGQLRVGEISEPIDSVFGFQILLRTEVEPRTRYAMAAVEFKFAAEAPAGQPGSAAKAREEAARLAKSIAGKTERFDLARKEICCEQVQQWTDGRGPANVTPVLARLTYGQIAREPVETESSYMIVRRLDPADVPPPPQPKYELPSPRGADIETILRNNNGQVLGVSARALSTDVIRELKLEGDRRDALRKILENLAVAFEDPSASGESRVGAWRSTLGELRKALGPSDFGRFDDFLNQWVTRQVLANMPE